MLTDASAIPDTFKHERRVKVISQQSCHLGKLALYLISTAVAALFCFGRILIVSISVISF